MDQRLRFREIDRRVAGSAHAPCTYPGNEWRVVSLGHQPETAKARHENKIDGKGGGRTNLNTAGESASKTRGSPPLFYSLNWYTFTALFGTFLLRY